MAKAILIKCLPATDTKPRRFKATAQGVEAVLSGDLHNDACPYQHAAMRLAVKHNWRGVWSIGELPNGDRVAVQHANPTSFDNYFTLI